MLFFRFFLPANKLLVFLLLLFSVRFLKMIFKSKWIVQRIYIPLYSVLINSKYQQQRSHLIFGAVVSTFFLVGCLVWLLLQLLFHLNNSIYFSLIVFFPSLSANKVLVLRAHQETEKTRTAHTHIHSKPFSRKKNHRKAKCAELRFSKNTKGRMCVLNSIFIVISSTDIELE